MKVLLAIDGSPHSQAALEAVASRDWPDGTEVEVLTIVHTKWPLVGDPLFTITAAHAESLLNQRHAAPEILDAAVARLHLSHPELPVTTLSLEGVPH